MTNKTFKTAKRKTNSKNVALITGGSSGIGLEFAKIFASEGHEVIIVANKRQHLNNASAQINIETGKKVRIISADLTKPNGAQKVYDEVQELGLKVNVLINNAGVGLQGEFAETDLKEELDMIRLNIESVVSLTKFFLPEMVKRKSGKILFTSSMSAITSTPQMAVYGATKAFSYLFAEALRQEVKDKGITITALLPGNTETNFFVRAGAPESEIVSKKADPADVAKAGYDALMSGADHVIPGMKNKLQAVTADMLPKALVARLAG